MKFKLFNLGLVLLLGFSSCFVASSNQLIEPPKKSLQTWNATENTQGIIDFINKVADEKSGMYVAPEDRIAVFDMDGTVLCEKPGITEVDVSIEFLKRQVKANPELAAQQPYKAVLADDKKYLKDSIVQVLLTPFVGYTQAQYRDSVIHFFNTTKHAKYDLYYKDLFYQPMLELIELLKQKDFTVYISSYSQQTFIRSLTTEYLGIDKEHSIGSVVDLAAVFVDDKAQFVRGDNFVLKNKHKAEVIEYQFGKAPILVGGNSSGDMEMFDYANVVKPHKVIVIDHDDEKREYQYTKKALLEKAKKQNWTIVSMKNDFKQIFK